MSLFPLEMSLNSADSENKSNNTNTEQCNRLLIDAYRMKPNLPYMLRDIIHLVNSPVCNPIYCYMHVKCYSVQNRELKHRT
jgi:uncharacterized membrane protein